MSEMYNINERATIYTMADIYTVITTENINGNGTETIGHKSFRTLPEAHKYLTELATAYQQRILDKADDTENGYGEIETSGTTLDYGYGEFEIVTSESYFIDGCIVKSTLAE